MKYFFWIAFAVFLAASIPHVAYFFASFEPTGGPEGIWWWAVSYAIAISIDVTVYLLSWTAFKRYRKYRTAKAVWQHWLLIIMCTVFSWAVNWAYAKQFHNASMLSEAEAAAPWLIHVFPFMASAFPLLGIVYTMMAETMTDEETEKKKEGPSTSPLGELAQQTRLPMATLRRALASGNRLSASTLTSALTSSPRTMRNTEELSAGTKGETEIRPTSITGQFITVEGEPAESIHQKSNPSMSAIPNTEGNPDKLHMTLEALKSDPEISDEALAERLALKRPASARFWRLKAVEILNTEEKENSTVSVSA